MNGIETDQVAALRNTRFPERKDRISNAETTEELPTVALTAKAAFSIPTALEIATSTDQHLRRSIETMDGESGMQVARTGREVRTAMDIATTVDRVVLASVGSMDGRE